MSNKKKVNTSQVVSKPAPILVAESLKELTWFEKLTSGFMPFVIIAILGFGIYYNTLNHDYALDDEIVICKNEFVLRGMSGMKDIFTKDIYHSFYEQMNTINQLSGGRYRPLSIASFAIEQEFIGTREDAKFDPNTIWDFNENKVKDAEEDVYKDGLFNEKDFQAKGFGFRHFNNIVFYILAVCMLFVFLSQVVFPNQKLLALIISLLFLAHPIHTEVVANVKSRDEIFSFFFMILTLWLGHKFMLQKSKKYLLFIGISFLAAILSKEYGATLLILLPLSMYLFGGKNFQVGNTITATLPMIGSFLFYILIRLKNELLGGSSSVQDSELLNNPFLLASDSEAYATKLYIFLKYFITLIIPHPLSSDYSYNSIPYRSFSSPEVWLSIFTLIGLIVAAFITLRKRHWLAFAIAFYLGTILLVTNLIFNVGATMGERLAFHASLGFCMVLGYLLFFISNKINKPILTLILALPIIFIYSLKTIARNNAWKNDISLALTDVKTNPESVSLNGNAGGRNLDLSEQPINKGKDTMYIIESIKYSDKAVKLHPKFVNGYLNLGLAYAKLGIFDSSKSAWMKAFTIYKGHPRRELFYSMLTQAYMKDAYKLAEKKQWLEGRTYLGKALEYDTLNARLWYDYGGFSQQAGDVNESRRAWTRAYQLNPSDPQIAAIRQFIGL